MIQLSKVGITSYPNEPYANTTVEFNFNNGVLVSVPLKLIPALYGVRLGELRHLAIADDGVTVYVNREDASPKYYTQEAIEWVNAITLIKDLLSDDEFIPVTREF